MPCDTPAASATTAKPPSPMTRTSAAQAPPPLIQPAAEGRVAFTAGSFVVHPAKHRSPGWSRKSLSRCAPNQFQLFLRVSNLADAGFGSRPGLSRNAAFGRDDASPPKPLAASILGVTTSN